MLVDLFVPCYIDQFSPQTAINMVRILERLGCSVHYNVEQTCCGQPAFSAGFWDDCKGIGEKFIKEFLNDRYIVTPSTACAGFVRNQYGEMFHNSVLHNEYKQVQRNMYEFSDFLVNVLRITNLGAILDGKAAILDTCTGLRNYGIKNELRILLSKVRGLELVELQGAEVCCGFGGVFSEKFSGVSSAMAASKLQDVVDSGARYLISADYSCLTHLKGYAEKNQIPVEVMHIADVLSLGWD